MYCICSLPPTCFISCNTDMPIYSTEVTFIHVVCRMSCGFILVTFIVSYYSGNEIPNNTKDFKLVKKID